MFDGGVSSFAKKKLRQKLDGSSCCLESKFPNGLQAPKILASTKYPITQLGLGSKPRINRIANTVSIPLTLSQTSSDPDKSELERSVLSVIMFCKMDKIRLKYRFWW